MTRSPFQLAVQRLVRNRVAIAGGILLALIGLACVLLPALLKLDPSITAPACSNRSTMNALVAGTWCL